MGLGGEIFVEMTRNVLVVARGPVGMGLGDVYVIDG